MWKKIISTLIVFLLIITMCSTHSNHIEAASEDGDICTNPWEELFTEEITEPADLEIPGEETTKNKEETTTKVTAGKKVKTAKAKIISATRKSRKAKKAKLVIKKIKKVKGYQVHISANKKFKKILVKKTYRNNKITITSKSLRNKKKLYVRVRAYRLNGKTKVWGSWSNKKLIKIKK